MKTETNNLQLEKEIYEKGLFEVGGNVVTMAYINKIFKSHVSLLSALKDADNLLTEWAEGVNYPTLQHIKDTIKKAEQ